MKFFSVLKFNICAILKCLSTIPVTDKTVIKILKVYYNAYDFLIKRSSYIFLYNLWFYFDF